MTIGEVIPLIGNWAQLNFVENKGAAFGLELGGDTGKLLLSLFRILMVGFLIYMLRKMIKTKEPVGFLIFFSLIIAGAIGNIIDSIFYGIIFSASSVHTVATAFPEGGGYAPVFYGKVVDMLHFPIYSGNLPDWFPFWPGREVHFFRFVFNIADASISTGVIGILLFYRKYFINANNKKEEGAKETETSNATAAASPPISTSEEE